MNKLFLILVEELRKKQAKICLGDWMFGKINFRILILVRGALALIGALASHPLAHVPTPPRLHLLKILHTPSFNFRKLDLHRTKPSSSP